MRYINSRLTYLLTYLVGVTWDSLLDPNNRISQPAQNNGGAREQ